MARRRIAGWIYIVSFGRVSADSESCEDAGFGVGRAWVSIGDNCIGGSLVGISAGGRLIQARPAWVNWIRANP